MVGAPRTVPRAADGAAAPRWPRASGPPERPEISGTVVAASSGRGALNPRASSPIFRPVSASTADFFYDYVDPASYLVNHELRRLAPEAGVKLSPRPFEIRRPPAQVLDPRDPEWNRYRNRMREEAERIGVELNPPDMIPWSRKAHELALLAREADRFATVHAAIYRTYFVDGRDIGRVDVLVQIGEDAGLERTAVKAALDVDRHLPDVREERSRAERLGVRGVPTLLAGEQKLEGFHPGDEIRTFLHRASDRS